MDKESKSGFLGSWAQGAVLTAVLGLGAFVLHEQPYVSDRAPDEPTREAAIYAAPQADVRLWQDPIGAIERARALRRANPAPSPDALEHDKRLEKNPPVIAVMLRGGQHPEFAEQRRRMRYAVLTAASTGNYRPRDSDHLNWYEPGKDDKAAPLPEAIPYEWLEQEDDQSAAHRDERAPRHILVLWLDDQSLLSGTVDSLNRLAGLLLKNSPQPLRVIGPARSDVLLNMVHADKPRSEHAGDGSSADTPLIHPMNFYSAMATVPDSALLTNTSPDAPSMDTVTRHFEWKYDKRFNFARTIASDDRMAKALIEELRLRGLTPVTLTAPSREAREQQLRTLCRSAGTPGTPSHIAVISEWDTVYGRFLRRAFRATEADGGGYCVDRFRYMRGLDGFLPGQDPSKAQRDGEAAAAGGSSDTAAAERRRDGSWIERAEGRSQFDYLRRIAKQMRAFDEELRRSSSDHRGLEAVGVLGNDVHDKLLVLQALRPELPDAIFFTTDLDARLLHPREQAWTRNLIVASSFGLALDELLQAGTPPFRDSYQTSVFFSTRQLIDDIVRGDLATPADKASAPRGDWQVRWNAGTLDRWLAQPRVYEIGRTQAFGFVGRSPQKRPPLPGATEDGQPSFLDAHAAPLIDVVATPSEKCRADWPKDCPDIHPPRSDRAPAGSFAIRWLVATLVFGLGLHVAVVSMGGYARATSRMLSPEGCPRRRRRYIGWSLFTLAALLLALPLLIADQWPAVAEWIARDGKPMVFTEGISLWPTELVRVATVFLGAYFVLSGWRSLSANQARISRRLRLSARRRSIELLQEEADARLTPLDRLLNVFRWDAVKPRDLPSPLYRDLNARAQLVWRRHVVQNRLSSRLTRTCVWVLVALALTVAFGELGFIPRRGPLSYHVDVALQLLSLLVLYFVIFFVADAALLCVSYLHNLRERTTMWPEHTLLRFERAQGFCGRRLIDHVVDIEFLVMRTTAVNRLVYAPFILLSMVLVSRSATFDDWSMPLNTKVLATLGTLIALGCAIALRTGAERSRRDALRHIDEELRRRCGDADAQASTRDPGADPTLRPPTVRQLELLRAQIANLSKGALAPYTQQPLLKALVLPFATVGGSTLLEYLRAFNL